MRSSRLLITAGKKFTGSKSSSPRRMPDNRFSSPHSSIWRPDHKAFSSFCERVPHIYTGCESLLERVSALGLPTVTQSCNFNKGPDLPKEPGLNQFHFKKFLRLKTIEFEEIHACLKVRIAKHILSPSLEEPVPPDDISTPTVYINKKTGNFVVPRYGLTGSWAEFENLLNTWFKNRNSKKSDPKLDYPKLECLCSSLPSRLVNQFQALDPVEKIGPHNFRDLLKNLSLLRRDFELEDFAKFGARVNKDLTELYFPIRYTDGKLIGLRRVCIEDNEISETNIPDSQRNSLPSFPHGLYEAEAGGTRSHLTEADGTRSHAAEADGTRSHAAEADGTKSHAAEAGGVKSCILVGSILDSVALSSRTDIPVITLPDWSNLHPDHLPFLDQFQTVFLWLSNDVHGSQNAKLFAQKIEEKKCRLVSCEYPNPLTAVRKKMSVRQILASARSSYHEFLTTFENLRDSVYLEFLQSDELMGVQWKRFDQLNQVLGGFRRGELTVFSGRTGSGKTTFLSEYSLDLCMSGVNTLWCSFEVKNTRLLKMMLKQFSLIDLDERMEEFDRVADRFTKLPLYLTDFHGSQEIHRVQEAMSHAVYVHDITHVIVDNMQFMLGNSGSFDRFQLQDNAIEIFRKFATSHNCHVTLVIHPRKEGEEILTANSIFGGAKATQEADNILLLQEEVNPQSFFKKKSIQVAKNRYAGDLGSLPLFFSKPTLTFSKRVVEQLKRASKKTTVPSVSREVVPVSGEVDDSSEDIFVITDDDSQGKS